MNCLWCDIDIIPQTNWETFLLPKRIKYICDQCEDRLEKINSPRCIYCSRTSNESICSDCKWWKAYLKEDSLSFNYSIYSYNDYMRELMTRWKYRGDYILVKMFQHTFVETFKNIFSNQLKKSIIVPIPLSEDRLRERCFNQAEALAQMLPLTYECLLIRTHDEKQAKKSRRERLLTHNPFKAKRKINKSVILVDDIYTTGTTIRHASNVLKENGCPNVYAYTLIRG